jgi:quinoprotein glucose dehydrogenase
MHGLYRLVLGALCCAYSLAIAPRAPADEQPSDDYREYEFAPRPAPDWVRMIDQGEVNAALAGLYTPAGVRVEVVAAEPTVINPVGMAFADDGTPYVLEWTFQEDRGRHVTYEVTFRDGTKATVNRMQKDVRDVLKTLHDTDGDGRYDTARVVMDDLEIPSGLLLHDGWIYLASVGHVIRRRPGADGSWEEEEIVRGLCGFHHHQASGLVLGHDGWLYISSGDDDNHGEGSDGSRATVLRTGAVFRCRPDGSQLTEFARGFRNPYRDVAWDEHFNMFHVDNDQEDGSKFQGVRLMHVQEGADYGWRLLPGTVCCRTDFVRGAVFGELPGKMPSLLKTGRGSPAGLLIYQGTAFPEFFHGLLIYPDVYRKLVRAYRVQRHGSTFRVIEQFELMRSDDGLFRPCQAVMGPDGAIYIVDWRTDSGGAGRLSGDGQHGRIYRLTWAGLVGSPEIPRQAMDTWSRVRSGDTQRLWELLKTTRDFEVRRRAARELVRRAGQQPEAVRAGLLQIVLDAQAPGPARAAALGAACQLWDKQVEKAMIQLLDEERIERRSGRVFFGDPNPELRRLAADALARHATLPPAMVAYLGHALTDVDPAARRARILMIGALGSRIPQDDYYRRVVPGSLLDALVEEYEEPQWLRPDVFVLDAYVRALEMMEGNGIRSIVECLRDEQEREMAVRLLEACRTRLAATEGLDRVLRGDVVEQLRPDQVRRLIETYPRIQVEPPISAAAVAEYLQRHPDAPIEIQVAGLQALGLVGGGAADEVAAIALRLLQHSDPQARLAAIQAIGDARLVAASAQLAEALADAQRSVAERRQIVAALGKLRSLPAPFTGVMSRPGVETVVDRLRAIAEDPQTGPVRGDVLNLLAQVDFDKAAPVALALLESDDPSVVATAIGVLGARPRFALQLGAQFVDGKLDRRWLPQVAAALRAHVDRDDTGQFAKLLTEVFRGGLLVSLDPQEVQRVENLVGMTGNPHRGRAVYLAEKSQCIKCHTLEGVGGAVGPDLSKVWQTHTVAKLLESMIDPSREIKEGFATWTVTTVDGQVHTGLKVIDNPQEVVIRDANGRDVRIPVSQVDEKQESRKSLMPEGVVAQLSFEEFIDLVAFLKDRPAQESLRHIARHAWVLGPLPPGTRLALPSMPNPQQRLTLPGGAEEGWVRLQAAADGRLELPHAAEGEPAVWYVLAVIESPRAGEVAVGIEFPGAVQLRVGKHEASLPEGTSAQRTLIIPVQQGEQAAVLRLELKTPAPAVRLLLEGAGAAWRPTSDP